MDDVNRIAEIERDIAEANHITELRKKSPLQRRLDRRARHSIVSNVSDCETDDEASYEEEEVEYDVENLHVKTTTAALRGQRRKSRLSMLGKDEEHLAQNEKGSTLKSDDEVKRKSSVLAKAGRHAKKRWGKLKSAIKIRQAMKQVHLESRKKIKEDRNAIHNDIVKFFKTRLQKGDKLLAKTETMGYEFGDLKSHVKEVYQPSGKVRIIFDVFVFITMIASFYISTYLFAFVPKSLSSFQAFVLYFSEVVYLFDAIHLSVVVIGSENQLVTDYTLEDLQLLGIMKRYLIIHWISALPLNIMLSPSGYCGADGRYLCAVPQAIKAVFFIDNLSHCKDHLLKMDKNGRYHITIQRAGKFCQIFLILFYIGHLIVNAWFYLNSLEDDSQNWFMVHHEQHENYNTLSYHQIPLGYFYAQSVYTTLLMLIGDGINPVTRIQYYFASFIMVIGIVFMAYIIGEISSTIAKLNHSKTQYELKLEDVAECMTNLDMPLDLKNRVLDYYRFMWTTHRTTDGKPIPFMKELSPSLCDEVDLFLKRSLIMKCELFKEAPPDYLRALVPRLNHMICLRGDYIAREGEFGDTMYFIASGSCLVSLRNKRIAVLNKGSNFGEIAMVVSKERTASVLALTNVTLYVLHKDDVSDLERHFPNVLREKIAEYLSKNNLVFSTSPNVGGKSIAQNLDVNEPYGNSMYNNTINNHRSIISPVHSEATLHSNVSPENSTRGRFLVGKPKLQFINKMTSEKKGCDDVDDIAMQEMHGGLRTHNENTNLFRSNLSETHFKEMIANVVSSELRGAIGTWMLEQRENNIQHQQNSSVDNFRRMSVKLKEQIRLHSGNQPAVETSSSALEGINETNNGFDPEQWRREKILAKRRELDNRFSLPPASFTNTSNTLEKKKSKYIATVNHAKILGGDHLDANLK
jgi:hypothetical protein